MPKGDFTRNTFRKDKHFTRVLQQQGRVQLDADWNEQVDIDAHLRETAVRDIVGPCGAPQTEGGFRIDVAVADSEIILHEDEPGDQAPALDLAEADVAGRDTGEPIPFPFFRPLNITISPGRMYVDGILVELEPQAEVPLAAGPQPSPLVTVPAAALHLSGVKQGDWVQILSDFQDPDGPGSYARVEEILPADVDDDQQTVRLSVSLVSDRGFRRPRLRRVTTYTTQPHFPGAALPAADGTYFAYLHVWQRHLTPLENPEIRETALGGPDTATRMQTVWQVELFDTAAGAHCLSPHPAEIAPSTGRLRARTRPVEDTKDPCIVPASAGYTRLENQLYRVEVHRGGTLPPAPGTDSPTFKWSRDNGSIATEWLSQAGNKLTVQSTGRDAVLRFEDGGWLELIDDARELRGEPGLMRKAKHVDLEGDVIEIVPLPDPDVVDIAKFSPVRKVRRWDSAGALPIEQAAGNDGFLALEGGIEIRFETGTYRTGDYWLIPARAFIGQFSGDIEWPQEGGVPGTSLAVRPHGIGHHYCRLAVLQRNTRIFRPPWDVLSDCRPLFPPLTELTRLVELCACDQEALPGHELPEPLTVQVVNGQRRVAGASVLFSIAAGGGTLHKEDGPDDDFVVVTSDEKGLASCRWKLGSRYESQRVMATLLDSAGGGIGPDVCFTARQIVPVLHPLCCTCQEVLPGQKVPVDLAVEVWVGALLVQPEASVRFRSVRFRLLDGEGLLQPLPPSDNAGRLLQPSGNAGQDVVAETGKDGIARCSWVAGSTKQVQRVEASLFFFRHDLDGDGVQTLNDAEQLGPAVCFTATLSVAPGFPIDAVTTSDGQSVANDAPLPVYRLLPELRIACREPVADFFAIEGVSLMLPPKRSLYVTIFLPYFYTLGFSFLGAASFAGGATEVGTRDVLVRPVGFQPVVLAGRVKVDAEHPDVLVWQPDDHVASWLQNQLFQTLRFSASPRDVIDRLMVVVTAKGRFLWSRLDSNLFLNGMAFGKAGSSGRVDLTLPSAGGQQGSDFEMWFWLTGDLEIQASGVEESLRSSRITGTVTLGGAAASGASVSLFNSKGIEARPTQTTTSSGSFDFTGFPNDTFATYVAVATLAVATQGTLTASAEVSVGFTVFQEQGDSAEALPTPTPAAQRLQPPVEPTSPPSDAAPADKPQPPQPPPAVTLTDVRGIGPVALARLQEAGITRVDEVAALEPARLAEILKMPEARAKNIVENARLLLP